MTRPIAECLYAALAFAALTAAIAARATAATGAPAGTTPSATPADTPHTADAADRAKADALVKHLLESPAVSAHAKTVIREAWPTERDRPTFREFLFEALAVANTDYRAAMDAMTANAPADAEQRLRPLLDNPDPVLRVHAAALLARALIEQNKTDDARQLLEAWRDHPTDIDRHSFLAPEFALLDAHCLIDAVRYTEAAERLTTALRGQTPASLPPRLQALAGELIQTLRSLDAGGLGEVADLMALAGRRLQKGEPDTPVLNAQARAIELLDHLIEQLEQQAQQSANNSAAPADASAPAQTPANQPPAQAARESTLPNANPDPGTLRAAPVAAPGAVWGQLPARQRERILQEIRRSFPSRYRALVEQYYKQVGKEE